MAVLRPDAARASTAMPDLGTVTIPRTSPSTSPHTVPTTAPVSTPPTRPVTGSTSPTTRPKTGTTLVGPITVPRSTLPYGVLPYSTRPLSTTTSAPTTTTTIAGISADLGVAPATVPLETKGSNGHVSPVFAWLSAGGLGLALLMVLGRLLFTRQGGKDRSPLGGGPTAY